MCKVILASPWSQRGVDITLSYLIGSMDKGSFAMLLLKSEILHGGVGCHLKPFGVCALSSVFSLNRRSI